MAVVVKKFDKQFNFCFICKNKTKDLFNFLLPKFFIKWLMKKDHTHLDLKLQMHVMLIVVFVHIDL